MDECWRVLKPGGNCWLNLGDKYAGSGGPGTTTKLVHTAQIRYSGGIDRYTQASDVRAKSLMGLPWRFVLGLIDPMTYRTDHYDGETRQWILRAEVVWSKPNGLPESVKDRVRRSHENWFHLTKEPRYFAGVDEVREDYADATDFRAGTCNGGKAGVVVQPNDTRSMRNDGIIGTRQPRSQLGKLPGSVWSIPSQPLKVPPELGVDHFAAFPAEWPRRIIAGWSPVGICEACGEGRRAVVAKKLDHVNNSTMRRATAEHGEARSMAGVSAVARERATITGYACACPEPTAPTRPSVILDPFGGTGTVAMMARAMGRFGVSVDLSRDYNRLARWRIFESGHGERALAKAAAKKMPAPKKRKRRVSAITKTFEPVGQLQLSLSDPTALTREINSPAHVNDQEGAAR